VENEMDNEYKIMLKNIGMDSRREEKKSDQISRPTRRVSSQDGDLYKEVKEEVYIAGDENIEDEDLSQESLSILDNAPEVEEYNPSVDTEAWLSKNKPSLSPPEEPVAQESVLEKKPYKRRSHPTTVMNPWSK
jgi:hypothetical protein